MVQDGVTGLVVAPRSPAALAQALRGLLADPARRARLGAAGRARVLAKFTQARMLERVETIYTSIIQSPRL